MGPKFQTPTFKKLDDKTQFVRLAVDIIGARLLEDINTSGRASLLVSGGSTPGPVYSELSKIDIAWDKVTLGLVDERWVAQTEKGSNAALICNTLQQNKAASADFYPMKTQHKTAVDGQPHTETFYQTIPRPYSAAVLGMGTDGHTASWFFDADGLTQALSSDNKNLVQAITAKPSPITGEYLERMTLTLTALSQCKCAVLLLTGAEKRNLFIQALENPSSPLPIRTLIDALGERLIVLSVL